LSLSALPRHLGEAFLPPTHIPSISSSSLSPPQQFYQLFFRVKIFFPAVTTLNRRSMKVPSLPPKLSFLVFFSFPDGSFFPSQSLNLFFLPRPPPPEDLVPLFPALHSLFLETGRFGASLIAPIIFVMLCSLRLSLPFQALSRFVTACPPSASAFFSSSARTLDYQLFFPT